MLDLRFAPRRLLAITLLSPTLLLGPLAGQNAGTTEPTPQNPGSQNPGGGASGPRKTGGTAQQPKPQQPQDQPKPQQPEPKPVPPKDGRKETATFHYEPVHSRYLRLDPFDRYGRRNRWNPLTMSDGTGEYPIIGSAGLLDVYNTNKWKGDLPMWGENTFVAAELVSANLFETRDKAGADNETEVRSTEFLSLEAFHGDTVFRPPTWRVRANVAFDFRDVDGNQLSGFNNDAAVQELFGEALLWDMDPYLDFGSIRVGRQAFASDFRNLIFTDNNDGIQLFGSLNESKIDYQLAFFDLAAKNPFSNLNTFDRRDQTFFAANVFFEDLVATGYKVELTFQWCHDTSATEVDSLLNQIDPTVDVYYLGFNGEGRIGKVEVAHAFYWMTGSDDFNQLSGQFLVPEVIGKQDINAFMGAVEIAIPDDWRRYVFSALYASGDDDAFDGKGGGFDSVFDNPNFAGGAFGYFDRQAIRAGNIGGNGINLVNTNSFYPNLRAKAVNAPNSVNPGLIILHAGCEADLSNYWSVAFNAAYLQFANTQVLEDLSPVPGTSISSSLGVDLSLAAKYRPFGVDNVIITPGIQALFSTGGLEDLTGDSTLAALFINAVIVL